MTAFSLHQPPDKQAPPSRSFLYDLVELQWLYEQHGPVNREMWIETHRRTVRTWDRFIAKIRAFAAPVKIVQGTYHHTSTDSPTNPTTTLIPQYSRFDIQIPGEPTC